MLIFCTSPAGFILLKPAGFFSKLLLFYYYPISVRMNKLLFLLAAISFIVGVLALSCNIDVDRQNVDANGMQQDSTQTFYKSEYLFLTVYIK